MTQRILAAMAVLALSEAAPARAQFVVGPGHPFGVGRSTFAYRSGFGFTVGSPNFRLGFSGGFVTRSVFYSPFVGPFGPYAPIAPVGFGSPVVGGWGPGFGPSVVGVGVVVPVPVPVIVEPPEPPEPKVPPPALFPKGDFVVIVPRKDDPIPIPLPLPGEKPMLPVEKVAPVPKPVVPPLVPAFDPLKPMVAVKAEVVETDPKKEAARLIKLGKASFAAGDYGRAAQHFERASTADPA